MADKSKVVVISCDNYDEEKIYASLKAGLNELGGIESFVSRDEKILLKPNFLSAADPDKAVITHPSVIRGMCRILKEEGYGNVSYGDSPGHGSCKAAAEAAGLNPANTFGARLVDMSEEVRVEYPEGNTCNEFYFTKDVIDADAIINICKMKTHALERITGAVKNLYGLICGYRKAAGHVKYPNAAVFARMLVDIHQCVKPRLHIMDGVMAMEGNGPSGGTPIAMNVLMMSADPVALDTVFCYLINLDPELVPTNAQGASLKLGHDKEEDIEICLVTDVAKTVSVKELFELHGKANFDVVRGKEGKSLLAKYSKWMTRFTRRPYIEKSECIKCGICVGHCPVPGKAVDFTDGKDKPPVYDYSKCIRCYCCQEMCPKHAIKVKGKR